MWPYLCQFVTHSIDFPNLEVFYNALLGYMVKIRKFSRFLFMTSSLWYSVDQMKNFHGN